MATTEQFLTGSGTSYEFNIDRIKDSDIKVRVNNTDLQYTTSTPTSGQYKVSGTTITLGTAATAIHVYRETELADGDSVSYVPGSSIRAKDLNANHKLVRFASQEQNQLITNANVANTAEIAVSKLADGTARQLLQTDSAGTGVEWTSNVDIPGTLDVTGNTAFDGDVAISGQTTLSGNIVATGTVMFFGDSSSDQLYFGAKIGTDLIPYIPNSAEHNRRDLGSSTDEWYDLYLDGTAHIDTLDVDENATIAGTLGVTGTSSLAGLNVDGNIDISNGEIKLGNADEFVIKYDESDDRAKIVTDRLRFDSSSGNLNIYFANNLELAMSGFGIQLSRQVYPETNNTIDLGWEDAGRRFRNISAEGLGKFGSLNITGNITAAGLTGGVLVDASEHSTATANDTTVFSTAASDARYFIQTASSDEVLKSNYATWPTGNTKDSYVATPGAIDKRITQIVDDVGGFVAIANEGDFPASHPDPNNDAGTIISITALSQERTASGSGVLTTGFNTVATPPAPGDDVTINGCGNNQVFAAGYGLLVQTTTTEHTYDFVRYVPDTSQVATVAANTTNINTVAGKATEIGRLGTADAVADMELLGTSTNVSRMSYLGVAGTVANMSVLGTSEVVADMDTIANTSNLITNIGTVAGNNANVTTVATNINSVNDFHDKYRIASSAPSSNNDTGDLYYNTSDNKLYIYNGSSWNVATELNATGGTVQGDTTFTDNTKLQLGTDSDNLEIYYSGTRSKINSNSPLDLEADSIHLKNQGNSLTMFECSHNGATKLYGHGSSTALFETTTSGGKVSGRFQIQNGITTAPTLLIGANNGGSGMNNNSTKYANICSPQYLSDTQTGGFRLLSAYGNDGANYVYIGGNDDNVASTASAPKSATEVRIFTAATATGNGVEAFRIDSSQDATFTGNVTVNSPEHDGGLSVLAGNNNQETRITLQGKASNGTAHDWTIGAARSSDRFYISNGSSTHFTILDGGETLFGHTSSIDTSGYNPKIQVMGSTAHTSSIAVGRFSNDASSPSIHLTKSRNGTVGNHGSGDIHDNDVLGNIFWWGSDSVDYEEVAHIGCKASANFTQSSTPGDLTFWTTSAGATVATEKFRVRSTGRLDQFIYANAIGLNQTASGNHYIRNSINANRSGADSLISETVGLWNGKDVAKIKFVTGSDTTNKDDGYITFETSSADNITERLRISSDGTATFTGNVSLGETLTVTGANPNITFVDSDNNPDYKIYASNAVLTVLDSTNNVNALTLDKDNATFTGALTATPAKNANNNGFTVTPGGGTTASSFKVLGNSNTGASDGRNGGAVFIDANYYAASSTIFSVSGRGTEVFSIDAEGDTTVGGDLTVAAVAGTANMLKIPGHDGSSATQGCEINHQSGNFQLNNAVGNAFFISDGALYLRSGGNNDALTLDGSQNANFAGTVRISQGVNDTDFTNNNLPGETSGLYVANTYYDSSNPTHSNGNWAALTAMAYDGATNNQSASFIAQSVAGGTSPELHITQRDVNTQRTAIKVDKDGKVYINYDGTTKAETIDQGFQARHSGAETQLKLYRSDNVPVNNPVGRIYFIGKQWSGDGSNASDKTYCFIETKANDTTPNSVDSELNFFTKTDGSDKAITFANGGATFSGQLTIPSKASTYEGITLSTPNSDGSGEFHIGVHEAGTSNGRAIVFKRGGTDGCDTESMRIGPDGTVTFSGVARPTSNGQLDLGSGNNKWHTVHTRFVKIGSSTGDGIQFSAYDAGTDITSNTLDDYEEGNHNPTDVSGASLSFTNNNTGIYTKIGGFVHFSFDITFPSTSNGSDVQINAPFMTDQDNHGGGVVGYTDLDKTVLLHINTSGIFFREKGGSNLTNAACSGKRFIGQMMFRAT